jgi:hypothetical protein
VFDPLTVFGLAPARDPNGLRPAGPVESNPAELVDPVTSVRDATDDALTEEVFAIFAVARTDAPTGGLSAEPLSNR